MKRKAYITKLSCNWYECILIISTNETHISDSNTKIFNAQDKLSKIDLPNEKSFLSKMSSDMVAIESNNLIEFNKSKKIFNDYKEVLEKKETAIRKFACLTFENLKKSN